MAEELKNNGLSCMEDVWDKVMDQVDALPDGVIFKLSVGRKSILLMFALLCSDINFNVMMVDVENRMSIQVNDYKNKILNHLKNLGFRVDVVSINCTCLINEEHIVQCPKAITLRKLRDADKVYVSGWNRSVHNKNVIYPFFGLSDEIIYALYNQYVPNSLRPLEVIRTQCECPYGRHG